MSISIRVVDLFCGCGGLSLGFDLYKGSIKYETILGLDNWVPAVKTYNLNHINSSGKIPTARLGDLTWFNHPSEVLLYYLVHFSLSKSDAHLYKELADLELEEFFHTLSLIDNEFNQKAQLLSSSDDFTEDISIVDKGIFNIAIYKSYIKKLGLTTVKDASIDLNAIPWREEYEALSSTFSGLRSVEFNSIDVINQSVISLWDNELNKLEEASEKTGRGQHSVVAHRLKTFVEFMKSESGKKLRALWIDWRTHRDSLRAYYCTKNYKNLANLYKDNRQVHLILGGPPCKGFSRIGRAVIESLRDQGVHAWASNDYGDERNALLLKYVLFLEALKPDVFIFENVAHFSSRLKTPNGFLDAAHMLSDAINDLSMSSLHYYIESQILKAKEFAIPQDRQRFIMVGFNRNKISEKVKNKFFNFTKYSEEVPLLIALQGLDKPGEFSFVNSESSNGSAYLSKAFTLVDANMPESYIRYIRWIRQAKMNEAEPLLTDAHIVRVLRKDDLSLIEKFAPGQRWMDYKLQKSNTLKELRICLTQFLNYVQLVKDENLPSIADISKLLLKVDESLLLRLILEESDPSIIEGENHLLNSGYLDKGSDQHGDWFERLSPDKPCKTIVAHIGKDTYGYIHPYSNRAISIREAARIQSFPDFFSFGSVGIVDGYSMIGNAVPPLLANMFANKISELHQNIGLFGLKEETFIETEEKQMIFDTIVDS